MAFGSTHDSVPEPFDVSTEPSDPAVSGSTSEYPVVADGGVIEISFLLDVCSFRFCVVTGTGSCAHNALPATMNAMAARNRQYVGARLVTIDLV